MTALYVILSLISGSGATVAVINVYGKLRAKSMDIALEERKQFVAELNQLRSEVNTVYKRLNDVVRENGELKVRVKELEAHITHKSGKLTELKELIEEYQKSNGSPNAQENLIKNVIELVG